MAAAYIVFLALVLIYVAIMAIRLGRVERKLEALRSEADHGSPARAGSHQARTPPPRRLPTHTQRAHVARGHRQHPQGRGQERETV